MSIEWFEVAAVAAPFTTLAAALGTVWLQQQGEPGRELRNQRRDVYVRLLQHVGNTGTRVHTLIGTVWKKRDRMLDLRVDFQSIAAELELVGPAPVVNALTAYTDRLAQIDWDRVLREAKAPGGDMPDAVLFDRAHKDVMGTEIATLRHEMKRALEIPAERSS